MKKHKKLLIIVTAVVLVIISVLFVSLMGKGSGEDICSKAINNNDYRTFYNQACATKGHPKDEFIKACEKSGKKFYDDPNSSSDECVSEEEYDNRVANDNKAKEEKEKKKAECEANEGKWDGYSCKNKEQLEAEAKAAEEKKKQEEAKKDEEEQRLTKIVASKPQILPNLALPQAIQNQLKITVRVCQVILTRMTLKHFVSVL